MGTDKAFVAVDGIAMVARVVAALREAGANEVLAVGGDEGRLLAHGLDRVVADTHPGAGPLGALVVALAAARSPLAVVVACDMPYLDAGSVRALVQALEQAPAAVAAVAEPLCAAWRPARARAALAERFAAGERAVHRAIATLPHVGVEVSAWALHNVNRPSDLTPP